LKTPFVHPVVSLAALCILPVAVSAQTLSTTSPTEPPPVPAAPVQPTEPPVQFRALAGVEHDSNVFRTPAQRSDEIFMVGLGLKLEKRLGLQRFVLDAEIDRYKHRELSELDYTTINYSGAWNWSITPRLRGVASAVRNQYRELPDTFEGQGQVGVRTDRTDLVEGLYEIGGGWSALAGVSRSSSTTTNVMSYDANPRVARANIGVGYEFPTGSSIIARLYRGEGEYQVARESDFNDTLADVAVKWQFTPRTSLDGRVGYLRREHDRAPLRDFSGAVGEATFGWEITAKTRLLAGASRDLGSYYQPTGGYIETNRVYVAPVWKPTAQTALSWRVQHERRSFKDLGGASVDQGRRDVLNWAQVGFSWEPRRAVTVSSTLRSERRKSNVALFNYRATVVGVAAKFTF
jgi:exopolysaccharide biosynthesis operon protein EpsL